MPGLGIGIGLGRWIGSGGEVPFSPLDYSPGLWHRAGSGAYTDAGSTLATNGQTVQQWRDLSGNGRHSTQSTSDARMTLTTGEVNGRSVLRLDGVDDHMVCHAEVIALASGNDKPLSIYLVYKVADLTQTRDILAWSSSIDNQRRHQLQHTTTPKYQVARWAPGESILTPNGGTPNTSSFVLRSHVFTGTSVSEWIGGSNIINGAALDFGPIDFDRCNIGMTRILGSGFNPFKGDIAEIIVYPDVHTTEERENIEAYLTTYYGL